MTIAKTAASGGPGLHPEVLAFTSSLALDKALLTEDLVGSIAHLTMLSRTRLIPSEDARAIREQLVAIWKAAQAGTLVLAEEEDVHMAVEAELTRVLGERAGLLHTARSRNDQVALDLRLHVREKVAEALGVLATLLDALAARAEAERDTLIPSYTHRQRAQPISLAYLLCGYGAMFTRDVDALGFVLEQVASLPLGVGAIGGTSLPIDREVTRELLRFPRVTMNGLDTVGDRDFAMDFAYAAMRSLLHASRVATDFYDFASPEFGFVKLDGEIACGSSMMPQKRNPDVFELIRGKSGRAVGNLNTLAVLVKGLPGGYSRDLQEDRQVLLETGPLLTSVLSMLNLALGKVYFDKERCFAAVESDYMQATDVAEALAMKGIPFRTAYKATGALVRACQERGLPLAKVTLELAQSVDPRFDAEVLKSADPRRAVERKANAGGTGPASVEKQIAGLKSHAARAREMAAAVPRLGAIFDSLQEAAL
ncbi:argininosuccinate lyase [Archangium sp. Cb G35]|uniref:argininosuccinate lyase n=1 Tax=Archangium sp. Cb G35 TaxID=1920190 RepID=UPI0009378BB9|nr:argininosuccinate lyase [Archangium sp. Cb G35]OJT21988.1 argininosuccinate lyase [Archangium sp. Cb G35]